jgi:hypothetical protein
MAFLVKRHSKSEFYETFSKWLFNHNFPIINEILLPENVFVVYNEDIPVYCMWFYFTDSKLVWLAFPASNSNIPYKKRDGGLRFLLNHIENYAKKKGIKMLFTTSDTESVVKVLTTSDFSEGDLKVNQYFKRL